VPRAGPCSGDSPNGESLKAVSRTSPRVVSFAPVARCLSSSNNGFGMVSGLNASDAVCLSQTHPLTKRFPLVALQLCFQEMAFFGSFNAASTASVRYRAVWVSSAIARIFESTDSASFRI